jgi:hypothetical protein
MYLKADLYGLVTRKHYGKQGDPVEIVSEHHEMILIKVNGHLVHVHPDKLTNARIENTKEDNSGPTEERVAGNKSHPVKRSRVPRSNGTKGGTGDLFGG